MGNFYNFFKRRSYKSKYMYDDKFTIWGLGNRSRMRANELNLRQKERTFAASYFSMSKFMLEYGNIEQKMGCVSETATSRTK